MSRSARILLGRIVGASGIRGEVLVHSYAEAPEDVAAYGPLSDRSGSRQFSLRVVRATTKGLVARIEGIADRNAAEALKGVELFVERSALPAVDDVTFYHADLVGMTAVAPDGTQLGEIRTVQDYGAGPLLEVALGGRTTTELVPFSDAFVPKVDLSTRTLVLILPVSVGEPEAGETDEVEDQRAAAAPNGTGKS